jgi:AcrR family transcriptional regulator
MSSQRHNSDRTAGPRDSYLDAARACILDVGWRRTTLTEVARRAGVSRMTIYRTWSDMSELLGDLMTREWGDLLTAVGETGDRTSEPPHPDGPERAVELRADQGTAPYDESTPPSARQIADGVLRAVTALRENELFVRIVELDPELILPYLLARRGRSQEIVIGLLAENVAAGQAAGTVREGDPVTLARTIVLAAHGFVLSAHTMVDDTVDAAALDEQLAALVARTLTPEAAG